MLENKVIMKTYKEIKKYKQIDVNKEYEDDNYLIQTLKRTSKCKHDKKILDYQNNIKDLLSYIYKEIQLENDPKVKVIKDENDDFHKKYKSISNNFQKSTKQIFKDLIRKYNQRGYKIPDLSYKHGLFKINALIEQNRDKIEFIIKQDKKNKNKNSIIASKTLAYLQKLNFILNILLSKDENSKKKILKFSMPKHGLHLEKKESVKDLKKSIENLNLLLKTNNINLEQPKLQNSMLLTRKSSVISRNNFNTIKLIKPRIKPRQLTEEFSNLKNPLINKTEANGNISNPILLGAENKKCSPSNILNERLYSNKTINAQFEIKNITNNLTEENTLNSTPLDINHNLFTKTSKLINKNNLKNLINKDVESNNNDDNSLMRKSYNLNTISNYKNNKIDNNNNRYSKSYSKKVIISLKKSININNLKKIVSHEINTSKNMNRFYVKTFGKPKTAKEKTIFFVKTQSLEKKYISRNSKLCFNNKKKDNYYKTQDNFFKTTFKTQDEYLEHTYKRLKKGNYNNMEELIRKYLREIKKFDQSQEDLIISHYNYKNIKTNLSELKDKIKRNNIGKKTERIYFNNHISKRILPLISSMKEKEIKMHKF